jgi:NADH-quinone oxidoreductase subunit L
MSPNLLLLAILVPAAAGVLALLMRGRAGAVSGPWALLATAANLGLGIFLFDKQADLNLPWAGFGLQFVLRLYQFSGFIVLATACFGLLVALYSIRFMAGRANRNQFYGWMLLSLAMVNGAVLANHLVVLLFFWEGLLGTLFAMIAIGRPGAWRTATKAFIIIGISDVCMMLGMALAGWQAHTLIISDIHLPLTTSVCTAAFVLLMIGAISKGGSMPFHSWIPDAAVDAPLPFMAFLPASLEKLLGIYWLARISLDLFELTPDAWVSPLMMIVGAATILLAVSMALVQKDYKRLLAYHAISQVGYMVLGIGTAVPLGIVGGLFHMLNNAIYKSGLFLTGGAVEHATGTTDLKQLGGLGRRMPVTFACFFILAASISGVPWTNGFFSKELIYDGALARHWIFYAAALLGSVLTAASFLKLGHAAYLGKPAENSDVKFDQVREAPPSMLLPIVILAAACLVFGLGNALPIDHLIAPAFAGTHFAAAEHGAAEHFAGWPESSMLVLMTCLALAAAIINHLLGAKRAGSGLGAVDHIHHAPGLAQIYDAAGKRYFDPYDIGMALAKVASRILWLIDRLIDGVVAGLTSGTARGAGYAVSAAHTGSYALYVVWSILGAAAVAAYMLMH